MGSRWNCEESRIQWSQTEVPEICGSVQCLVCFVLGIVNLFEMIKTFKQIDSLLWFAY